MAEPTIILASSSPRRIELMRQAGLRIIVMRPDADESALPGEKPEALVRRLSRDKCESVARARFVRKVENALVVAADTIVVSPDSRSILGKPRDNAEARRMLKSLCGRTHTVLTGYCIAGVARGQVGAKAIRVVRSRVRMRSLSAAAIRRYVESGEPSDKAGAYAAQGIGMSLIDAIDGSYTNVVGLPMSQLLADLEARFGLTRP